MSAQAVSGLFQAVNGLRNTRALVAMIGCAVAGVLVAGALMAMAGTLGALAAVLAFVVYVVAMGTGVNAAGLLHMDTARGISPRSTVDALVHGLLCIPKLIVLGIALFLVELAVFIVIALVLAICKIPFLGPLLFTVVFPISVVLAGVTVFGLFLCLLLSLPAIWQGASIMRALSQTLAIARSRLVESVLLLVVVWLLSFAVGLVIFGVLAAGLMPTLGLSASIVGFGDMGGMGMGGLGGLAGMGAGLGGGGHAIAGAIGGAILWAIAASLVAQVYLLGLCLVYLRVTDGLDLTAAEAALRQKLDEARRRAGELGDKARSAATRDTAVPSEGGIGPASGTAHAMGAAAASITTPMAPPSAYQAPPRAPQTTPSAYAAPVVSPPPAASAPPDIALDGPDIALPFDDTPTLPPTRPSGSTPGYAAPPAYMPPARPPVAAPAPAPALPPVTTCPQCLSAVSADDLFCGVCGYRLK
jgi:hypothetical protein